MITPSVLKKGDKVAIVATAKRITQEEVSFAVQLIESWGLDVVLGKHLFDIHHQFAGTDENRLSDFQTALNNPDIKAIICARGGYGTVRIVDKIDFSVFQKHPKWIVGYSDITVFHSHIFTHFKTETIHSTMLISFPTNTPEALESLRKALFGEKTEYTIPHHTLNRIGTVSAPIVGGNLSILQNVAGTNSDISTAGCILFLEDLDEYLYHIDRMMHNLKKSGKLNKLAGLIVGGMTVMKDNPVPFGKTAEEIIWDAVKEFDYPVCFNFPCGHIDDNRSLILGRNASLKVTKTLSYFSQE